MKFTVYGEPRGKGRPRFSTRGGFVKTYTDKETASYENLIKLTYLEACDSLPQTIHSEAELKIMCYFPVPKSVSKKAKENMLLGVVRHTKKPDLDNIIKAVLDGLNKVAFDDDKQVVRLIAEKSYSEQPRIEIEINEWH